MDGVQLPQGYRATTKIGPGEGCFNFVSTFWSNYCLTMNLTLKSPSRFSGEKIFCTKIWENGPKMGQKQGFLIY